MAFTPIDPTNPNAIMYYPNSDPAVNAAGLNMLGSDPSSLTSWIPSSSSGGGGGSFLSRAGGPFGLFSSLGGALTSFGAGSAQGQQQQANANQNQFRAGLQGFDAQLQRANLASQLQSQDYKKQILGSLLQNMQDFTVTPPANLAGHVPVISGGLRPSAIGPNRQGIGLGEYNTATQDLLGQGNPNTGYTGVIGAQLPNLPPLPSSTGSTIASDIGGGLGILGSILPFLSFL